MGMFDNYKVFTEHYKEGETFLLTGIADGGTIETEYGPGQRTLLSIRTKSEGDQWFSLFGQAIASQASQLGDSDLPARVSIERIPTKDGKRSYKRIVPEDQDKGSAPNIPTTDKEIPF